MQANTIENLVAELADNYNKAPNDFNLLKLETIQELRTYVMNEFNQVIGLGQKVEFLSESECLVKYGFDINDFNAVFDMYRRQHLVISTSHINSMLLPGGYTLFGRTVHDLVHLDNNYAFDFLGEYQTFLHQSRFLSTQATKFLFSDIVMQASYKLHFGYYASNQKTVLMPIDYIDDITKEVRLILKSTK